MKTEDSNKWYAAIMLKGGRRPSGMTCDSQRCRGTRSNSQLAMDRDKYGGNARGDVHTVGLHTGMTTVYSKHTPHDELHHTTSFDE